MRIFYDALQTRSRGKSDADARLNSDRKDVRYANESVLRDSLFLCVK